MAGQRLVSGERSVVALSFLLVPDAGAARRLRRRVAEGGARSGVLVGTWDALVDTAQRVCLAPKPDDGWDAVFAQALAALPDAFWGRSLAVAPAETMQVVETALVQLLGAHPVGSPFDVTRLAALPARPQQHVRDLLRLVEQLDGRLPGSLAVIRDLLATDVAAWLHPIRVLHVDAMPTLDVWQQMLVDTLNREATRCGAGEADPALVELLRSALADAPAAPRTSALGVLQRRLFRAPGAPVAMDASLQWVGVRDVWQEAEVAAGMVQRMLAGCAELRAADIGLLVPDRDDYAVALHDAFRLAGLPLSGLPVDHRRRDLGREAVCHFLDCRQRPAPAMALAACLVSPLMPWTREQGARFAQAVMDGDYRLQAPSAATRATQQMLDLLRSDDCSPDTLADALRAFSRLLAGGEACAVSRAEARESVARLCDLLTDATDFDRGALRRMVQPRLLTSGDAADFNQEGVTVWRESQEAWRPVQRLLVLGFAQGHYPTESGSSPVFSADERDALRNDLGLSMLTAAEEQEQRRARLRRQLGAVRESVTFLVPRRDLAGRPQTIADSLLFMHPLFEGPASAAERVLDSEVARLHADISHLPLATPMRAEAPRRLIAHDLHLDRDLLALRMRADGSCSPESPSSLEALMVSPLAWLLRRLQAEPLGWSPESADPRLLGTLAHAVFEQLFRPDLPLPARAEIAARTAALLDAAIRDHAPFLLAPPWQVERRHLAMGIVRAAAAWRDALEGLGAERLGSEVWLQGTWNGIPVHGQTDLLLGLPDGSLLVVDYKRSASKGRLAQMRHGYDSQANLYRIMLQTGGAKDPVDAALAQRLDDRTGIGTVYYMLNDQIALADTRLPGDAAIPGWQTLDHDVSGAAMALLRQRLNALQAGRVALNRAGDAEFFRKKAGVTPYALENSPLITLFTLPDSAQAEESP